MELLYAVTLVMSLLSGSAAFLAAVLGRIPPQSMFPWTRLVVPTSIGAWVALLVSVTTHLAWEHAPGSPSALPPADFVREHFSFVIAALIPGGALLVLWKRERETPIP